MKIILMGEPMGLFMANETGPLSKVKTFTASIAGAEYNVAVGLEVACTMYAFYAFFSKGEL